MSKVCSVHSSGGPTCWKASNRRLCILTVNHRAPYLSLLHAGFIFQFWFFSLAGYACLSCRRTVGEVLPSLAQTTLTLLATNRPFVHCCWSYRQVFLHNTLYKVNTRITGCNDGSHCFFISVIFHTKVYHKQAA